jgi:hypothetical protein
MNGSLSHRRRGLSVQSDGATRVYPVADCAPKKGFANQRGSLMSLDVFITFSRQDLGAADRVCQALEASGIQCWMAHRDIAPGRGYLGPVLEAADHCRALLLLVSSHTTSTNTYVVDRSARRGVPIIWLMIDNATPPTEFERFRKSSLVIDASVPPLESHFRSLAARITSLLNPTRAEDWHEFSSSPTEGPNIFEHGPAGYSLDESALPHGRGAPLGVRLPSDAAQDEVIESVLRTAAEVLSELHAQEARITPPDAAARARPVPHPADREQLPTAVARSEALELSIRPTPPNSRQNHAKRTFALIVAGLAVLAFGAGTLFSKEIVGLLHAIAESLRDLGAGAVMRPLSLVVTCVQVPIDLAVTVVISSRDYQYGSHSVGDQIT